MINLQLVRQPASQPAPSARRLVAGLLKLDRAQPLPRLVDVHPGRPTAGRWVGFRIDADITELDLSPDNVAAISAKEN